MAKHHLPHATDAALTLCELAITGPWPRPLEVVAVPDARTCRRCARAYEPPEPPVDTAPYVPSIGARQLSARAAREIERSRRGEDPVERQWPTPEAAVRSLIRARVEGVSVRSTSDVQRTRVQSSRDPSLGGREHARVDAHRTASLALDRAEASLDVAHTCPGLTAPQALEVYAWRVVGRVVLREVGLRGQPRKGRVADWLGMPGAEVALYASERFGVEVTERHVSRIVRHVSGAVRDALVASGEMRASAKDSDKETDDMAVRGFELSGWEQIEAYTGIGRDVLRRLVARETDPIPVKQVEGVRGYHARKADLDAWIARNERHAAAS